MLKCFLTRYLTIVIKYYNKYLESQEAFTEAIKYTTNHESCVFNDTARNIISGHGYEIK